MGSLARKSPERHRGAEAKLPSRTVRRRDRAFTTRRVCAARLRRSMYRHFSRAPSRRPWNHARAPCRRHLTASPNRPKEEGKVSDYGISSFEKSGVTEDARNDNINGTQGGDGAKGSAYDKLEAQLLNSSTEDDLETAIRSHRDNLRNLRAASDGNVSQITSKDPDKAIPSTNAPERDGQKPRGAEDHNGSCGKPATAADDVRITSGIVSPGAGSSTTPADLANGHLRKPKSAAQLTRMTMERPKWGGSTAPPSSKKTFRATYDTLRRGDKVTPHPERPPTASSEKPWGFDGSRVDNQRGDSSGDIVTRQMTQDSGIASVSENPVPSENGSFAGMMGFKRLRQMLSGQPQQVQTQVKDATSGNDPPTEPAQYGAVDASIPQQSVHGGHERSDGPSSDRVGQSNDALPSTQSSSPVPTDENAPSDQKQKRRRARMRRKERRHMERENQATDSRTETTSVDASGQHQPKEDSPVPAPEIEGRPLAEVLQGQHLADAMGSDHRSEDPSQHPVVKSDVDDDDDGRLPLIKAKSLHVSALALDQPPVPSLSFGLDKVLFNPGVTSLQDHHSRVYNFDPYLQHIMPVQEFDFNALQQYKTSSQDATLSELAKSHGKKYVGSTSSMTSTLSHFHYLLSDWRDLNLAMLSRQFPETLSTFTKLNRAPTAIFLRWKNGTYAIDADKEHDSGNILMMLGKSMEKLLTMDRSEYERYRKSDPREITEEERNMPEAYQYTTMGDFLMRSQLDAYDSRLPGTGMFDIKTRAIASIRMSTGDYKPMLGYEIHTEQGAWESYEREYYDMMRSTMLKYMLQARMGRMDGIFLSYHNVERIFGFQYMPVAEIDRAIHGQIDRCLGDQEFKISLDLLNKVLEQATAKFPQKSLRFHFETRATPVTAMYIFAEPMEEDQIDEIQASSKERIAKFERTMMGVEAQAEQMDTPAEPEDEPSPIPSNSATDNTAPLYAATILVASRVNGRSVNRPERLKPSDSWTVEYLFKEMEDPAQAWATYVQCKQRRKVALANVSPSGDEYATEDGEGAEPNYEIHEEDGTIRTFETPYLEKLRQLAERGREYRKKMDAAEQGKEKVVWGKSSEDTDSPTATSEDSEELHINGVHDYMKWMFKDSAAIESKVLEESDVHGVQDYMDWMYKKRFAE